jgi:hypothetical protein
VPEEGFPGVLPPEGPYAVNEVPPLAQPPGLLGEPVPEGYQLDLQVPNPRPELPIIFKDSAVRPLTRSFH